MPDAAGLAIYASLLTMFAALIATAAECYLRALARRDKAVATALAANGQKLATAALGYVCGAAWGRFASVALSPSPSEGPVALSVYAVVMSAAAVAANIWLAESFPRRQAKLIVLGPSTKTPTSEKPSKKRAKGIESERGGDGVEASHV